MGILCLLVIARYLPAIDDGLTLILLYRDSPNFRMSKLDILKSYSARAGNATKYAKNMWYNMMSNRFYILVTIL